MSDEWWRNAVVYAVDVEVFQDSDGDGIGDLQGLRARLDHVSDLGATCVWLQPFYESPNRDGRYDVVNHCAVDPALGTLPELDELIDDLHRRGMRVLIDLVASHTSEQHPWFQASRRGDPAFRDHYVWRPAPDPSLAVEPIFPGVTDSVWCYDDEAAAHYLHRFYEFEPDLNTANPRVREAIADIMRFWLSRGVDGFRIDAAPYLAHKAAWADRSEGGRWFLRDLRRAADAGASGTLLVPEADVDAPLYAEHLQAGMDAVFDFHLNNELFLAIARRDARPLQRGLEILQRAGVGARLLNWVRNHDELDLGRLSDTERDEVYRRFAPSDEARIYHRGIRRRLPPMVGGDASLTALAHNVVFSLPGIPVLRYGEEIGMGDDLRQPERLAVRSPMQWSDAPGGGFSSAPVERWVRPPVPAGPFDHHHVNVASQRDDSSSLLGTMRRLIRARRACPELGLGAPEVLPAPPEVLALRYRGAGREVIITHNLGTEAQPLEVPSRRTMPIFPDAEVPPRRWLEPAGSCWFSTER